MENFERSKEISRNPSIIINLNNIIIKKDFMAWDCQRRYKGSFKRLNKHRNILYKNIIDL